MGSVLAGKARKVKISILREGSETKTIPVKAQLLLIRTLAATILWGGKAFLREPLLRVSIIISRASGRQTTAVACWIVRQMHSMATMVNFIVQGNAEGSVRRVKREMVCNMTCKERVSWINKCWLFQSPPIENAEQEGWKHINTGFNQARGAKDSRQAACLIHLQHTRSHLTRSELVRRLQKRQTTEPSKSPIRRWTANGWKVYVGHRTGYLNIP
jgi:hypothetical protein